MASESVTGNETATVEDMDIVNADPSSNSSEGNSKVNGDPTLKREREEPEEKEKDGNNGVPKKQKIEKSAEEERLENPGDQEAEEGMAEDDKSGPVNIGPKIFESSVDMFNYFYKLLHHWPLNINVNKYEQLVLLDLIKKGHQEPDKKFGPGVQAFQVRVHPTWKSRCFFLVRTDESADDFSFRKCIDRILPLPENMRLKPEVNKTLGGRNHDHKSKGGDRGHGGGYGRGRGRGRGGKSRR